MVKKLLTNKSVLYFVLLILVSVISSRSLLNKSMFLSHDGEIHVARLASFYTSLIEGNLFPRWGGNLNNGLGHPTLMFLYPLPNYFGSLFKFMGFSYQNSVKILFYLAYVLSGIFMYLFLKIKYKQPIALITSIIYLFIPYRFVDFFVRGALPENLFFMIAPISLLFLQNYLEKPSKKSLILSSIFLSSLILVHNASSFVFFPFIYIYFLISYIKKINFRFLLISASPYIFAFLLSFYYWYPAIIEGKYTLRSLAMSRSLALSHLMPINKLFDPNWGYGDPRFENGLSTQLGVASIVILIIFLYINFKSKKINLANYFLIASFLITSFLMTNYSRVIWQSNNIMYNLLYPWRLLVIIIFITTLISARVFDFLLKTKSEKFFIIFTITLSGILFILNWQYQKPLGYFNKSDYYYTNEYTGTADNGESSPIWSTLTAERKGTGVEIIEGVGQIQNYNKKSQNQQLDINIISDTSNIVMYTLYFPGWNLYDNGIKITNQIEFQDPNNRGLITFKLNKGIHKINLIFENTKTRSYSSLISFFSLIFLLIIPIKFKKNEVVK